MRSVHYNGEYQYGRMWMLHQLSHWKHTQRFQKLICMRLFTDNFMKIAL